MMERKDVIQGLRSCSSTVGDCDGHKCPYFEKSDDYEDGCRIQMERDALTLLTPIKAEIEGGQPWYWDVCGECHSNIERHYKFCPICGREIEWQ